MKIAIGGMQKNQMQQEVAKACPDVETVVTNDIPESMLKKGEADYYIGACESGGGSAIARRRDRVQFLGRGGDGRLGARRAHQHSGDSV